MDYIVYKNGEQITATNDIMIASDSYEREVQSMVEKTEIGKDTVRMDVKPELKFIEVSMEVGALEI